MMRFVFLALSLMVSAAAFAQSEKAKVETYKDPGVYLPEPSQVEAQWVDKQVSVQKYDDGKPKVEREISRFSDERLVNDGYYREYFLNGQLFVEGQYERGVPVGEWKYFHDSGNLAKTVKYENGKPHGEVEVRRPDGTLEAKRVYKDSKRDGEWVVYDRTGEKRLRELHYSEGEPDGVWKTWHNNGQLAQEQPFKGGKANGLVTEWDENGVKRAEAMFVDGKREGKTTIWQLDGKVVEQNFKDGKLVPEAGK
jgi:antitoxin component YwqK of YwqJK toxin-antitoxin module